MGKRHTPKAKQYRKRQLERLGYDEDKIADILDYEFDLLMGRYPNVPLEGQKYEDVHLLIKAERVFHHRLLRKSANALKHFAGV